MNFNEKNEFPGTSRNARERQASSRQIQRPPTVVTSLGPVRMQLPVHRTVVQSESPATAELGLSNCTRLCATCAKTAGRVGVSRRPTLRNQKPLLGRPWPRKFRKKERNAPIRAMASTASFTFAAGYRNALKTVTCA